jgi:DhnA family fructose-bisphosphate aldolase class Ia
MKTARLNRLFNSRSNRCFDVAIDHGFFNELSFLKGIEDIRRTIDILIEANPDAIQLTVGQARHLQNRPGKAKPTLVLRSDVANVYGPALPATVFSRMIEDPVLQAVQLDAACIVVNLFQIPDAPEVTEHCIRNILALKPACDHYGMPLMIEPLVFQRNAAGGGYMVDGDIKQILPLVRQGVELGADIIKADPSHPVEPYGEVIAIAGDVPVLVRGGGKATEAEILARTEALIKAGAAGIVYGRNIIQHPRPAAITRALMAVVHDGATADEALRFLR